MTSMSDKANLLTCWTLAAKNMPAWERIQTAELCPFPVAPKEATLTEYSLDWLLEFHAMSNSARTCRVQVPGAAAHREY